MTIALFGLLASSARATTVVVPSDEQLLAASDAVVEGRVTGIVSRRDAATGDIFTYVTLDVDAVLAGPVRLGPLVIKQMGGQVGDEFYQIHGSPEYSVGERVLVYLEADDDGALHTTFLFIGKFSILARDGRRFVERSSAGDGVLELRHGHDGGPATDSAPLEEYRADLLARAAKMVYRPERAIRTVPAEFAIPAPPGDATTHERFTLMGNRGRWFEPDEGLPVPFKLRYTSFLPDGGEGAAIDALAAWSNVDGCALELEYAGDTELCGSVRDFENTISFDDCKGQIGGAGCFGVIAIGGARGFANERKVINGVEFVRITDADVVLNDNQNTCLLANRLTLREILTHELGHCIGLGHSSQTGPEPDPRLKEATMYYALHEDGRGASIKPDDMDGVRFLYPAAIAPPTVETAELAGANLGSTYEVVLEATAGEPPYTWSTHAGTLPAGLSLLDTGTIVGVPTEKGTFAFTVGVADSMGRRGMRDLSIQVRGPIPVVDQAKWKSARKKLKITARMASPEESVEVLVNGVLVSPPATVKVKALAEEGLYRLTIKGTADSLNIGEPTGANQLVVRIDGVPSVAVSF